MANHKKETLPVRTLASILIIPTAIKAFPKNVKDDVKNLVTRIDKEIEQRKTTVNLMTD